MTDKAMAVLPETPLAEAVEIITSRGFSGLPVVNSENKLVGILTEYDLTVQGSSIYLPTFIKLIKEFEVYKKDQTLIQDDVKKLMNMKVSDIMNVEPLTLPITASVEDAVKTFGEHHKVNPIPVVDQTGELVGILSRSDLIKMFGIAPRLGNVTNEREVDKNVGRFLSDFEKQFVFVTKFRTRYWLVFSIAFLIVGFIIAMLLVLRLI